MWGYQGGGSMVDEVVLKKAARIERCVARALEEYVVAGRRFSMDTLRQDAVILNIQRAIDGALLLADYLIKRDKLGLPQSEFEQFDLLVQAGRIESLLLESLTKMLNFRQIALQDEQMVLPLAECVIRENLDDFLHFTSALLREEYKTKVKQ